MVVWCREGFSPLCQSRSVASFPVGRRKWFALAAEGVEGELGLHPAVDAAIAAGPSGQMREGAAPIGRIAEVPLDCVAVTQQLPTELRPGVSSGSIDSDVPGFAPDAQSSAQDHNGAGHQLQLPGSSHSVCSLLLLTSLKFLYQGL